MPEPQTRRLAWPLFFGFVGLADQGGQHVAVVEVVVVVGAVQIGGHDVDVSTPILVVIGFAQLDAGNFGNGVGSLVASSGPVSG